MPRLENSVQNVRQAWLALFQQALEHASHLSAPKHTHPTPPDPIPFNQHSNTPNMQTQLAKMDGRNVNQKMQVKENSKA